MSARMLLLRRVVADRQLQRDLFDGAGAVAELQDGDGNVIEVKDPFRRLDHPSAARVIVLQPDVAREGRLRRRRDDGALGFAGGFSTLAHGRSGRKAPGGTRPGVT